MCFLKYPESEELNFLLQSNGFLPLRWLTGRNTQYTQYFPVLWSVNPMGKFDKHTEKVSRNIEIDIEKDGF